MASRPPITFVISSLLGLLTLTPAVVAVTTDDPLDGKWRELSPFNRAHSTVVADSASDRLILFGGVADGVTRNEAWQLPLGGVTRWTRIEATGPAPARSGHSAIFDPVRRRMIVFGGVDGTIISSEVWCLDLAGPPVWTLLAPAGDAPGPRREHSAVYDAVADRMVVFGGSDETSLLVDEVWSLSLGPGTESWSRIVTPPGPAASAHHSAVVDATHHAMIVFGGSGNGDVWSFDLSSLASGWTRIETPNVAPATHDHVAVFDPVQFHMIVLSDVVRVLDLSGLPQWITPATSGGPPPSGGIFSAGAWDAVRHRMLIHGGTDPGFADTWAFSPSPDFHWSEVAPVPRPPMHERSTSILDSARGRVIVFGGTDRGVRQNDVWTFSLADETWAQLPTVGDPPAPRTNPAAIYDPVRDRMVVFGGYQGLDALNDTWQLTLSAPATWSRVPTDVSNMGERGEHSAIYDPVRDRMIVHGGSGHPFREPPHYSDTWALPLGGLPVWSRVSPSAPAPFRMAHAAVYDPVRDRMLVFGGYTPFPGTPALRNDVAALPLGGGPAVWSTLSTSNRPPVREGPAAVYDGARDRLIIAQGSGAPQLFDDAWALPLDRVAPWEALDPIGLDPGARRYPVMHLDVVGNRMLLAGGEINDTWFLEFADTPTATGAALVSATADRDRVALAWHAGDHAGPFALQRRTPSSDWTVVTTLIADGTGRIAYEDRDVVAGARYGYRLATEDGDAYPATEAWVDLPVTSLTLAGTRSNPSRAPFQVRFSLATVGPAALELLDVAGRRIDAREVGTLGAGEHTLELGSSSAAPGLYFIRLRAEGRTLTCRVAIVR